MAQSKVTTKDPVAKLAAKRLSGLQLAEVTFSLEFVPFPKLVWMI